MDRPYREIQANCSDSAKRGMVKKHPTFAHAALPLHPKPCPPCPSSITAPPPDGPTILHQDDALLIVDKPAGLLTVPGRDPAHGDCVQSRLAASHPESLLVHRLDMDTSGVMIFARTRPAQRHLGLQFERRHIRKTYVALVGAAPDTREGRIDAPIRTDWPNRPLQEVHPEGRPARTDWVTAGPRPTCAPEAPSPDRPQPSASAPPRSYRASDPWRPVLRRPARRATDAPRATADPTPPDRRRRSQLSKAPARSDGLTG